MTPKGTWLTNHPRSYRGWFPRRDVKLRDGVPRATDTYFSCELIEKGIVGVYLDEDVPEGIENRPIIHGN